MKKKKVALIGITVCLSLLLVIGISYSYWRFYEIGELANEVGSSCFVLTLDDTDSTAISLDKAYPISNEEGKNLTTYKFTITNNKVDNKKCLYAEYSVNLEELYGTTLDDQYVAVWFNKGTDTSASVTKLSDYAETDVYYTAADTSAGISGKSVKSRTLVTGGLASGKSVTYTLGLWMHQDTPLIDATQNQTFKGKIIVVSSPAQLTLAGAILGDNEDKGTADLSNADFYTYNVVEGTTQTTVTIEKPTQEVITTGKADTDTTSAQYKLVNSLDTSDYMISLFKEYSCTINSLNSYSCSLSSSTYIDPTTITDWDTNKYYFISESLSYNTSTGELSESYSSSTSSTFYRVVGASKETTTETWGDATYDTTTYTLTLVPITLSDLAINEDNQGLFEAEDNDGTSYYFRGTYDYVNNHVIFGTDSSGTKMCWQVIRINGDESVRLMYNGTVESDGSCYTGTSDGSSRRIGTSAFNTNDDAKYVGYMYGGAEGEESTAYDATGASGATKNETNSTIKTYIDTWYENNIKGKTFESYLVDSGFCNDRSFASNNTGTGYAKSYTLYGGYTRNATDASTPTSSLKCINSNDLFTLNSTLNTTTSAKSNGNHALTYPIGLITADELTMAGQGWSKYHYNVWTNSDAWYWSLSPVGFDEGMGAVFYANNDGKLGNGVLRGEAGVRPVINLRSDTAVFEGKGTSSNPYVIG